MPHIDSPASGRTPDPGISAASAESGQAARRQRTLPCRSAAKPAADAGGPDNIETYIAALRVYARSLCRNDADADDLLQETLLRALANIQSYRTGTNMRAWLFTVMRNRFYTNVARQARERPGPAGCVSSEPVAADNAQMWNLRRRELEQALADLPIHYREAIILVGALGESYKSAAQILDCDIGTIKSRVNRARTALYLAIGGPNPE